MLRFRGKDGVDLNQRRFDMMANPAASKRGRQPKARKFYKMDQDLRVRGRAGYILENRSLLLQGQLGAGPAARAAGIS
jgi:hypothetical protein